jgi:hypothetical protein
MFAAALLGCATTDLRQNGCDTNAAGVSPIITAFLAKVPGGHTTLMQPFRRRSPVSKVGSTTNIPFMRQDEKSGKEGRREVAKPHKLPGFPPPKSATPAKHFAH